MANSSGRSGYGGVDRRRAQGPPPCVWRCRDSPQPGRGRHRHTRPDAGRQAAAERGRSPDLGRRPAPARGLRPGVRRRPKWIVGGTVFEMWLRGTVRLPQGPPPHDCDKTGWAAAMPPMLAQPSLPAPSRWPLPSVVTSELRHVPSPEAVPVLCQPVAQPGRAGRRIPGCQQASYETDNLVIGKHHVTHHQAHQPGQGETHARRRVQEPPSDAH